MKVNDKKLLLHSTNSAINKAKINGKLNLKALYLINIINSFLGKCSIHNEHLNTLVTVLKNRNNIFCSDRDMKSYKGFKKEDDSNINLYNAPSEIIPTVDGNNVDISDNIYQFKYSDFTNNFNSYGRGLPKFVNIITLPSQGVIKYNNDIITTNFIFDLTNINKLKLDLQGSNGPILLSLQFKTSNNSINTKFSNMATFTFNVDAYVNQPPSAVGDNSITINNASTHIFTVADFTTNTTPVYQDPENDAADRLKVLTLPAKGVLKLNGIAVLINAIINFTDIANSSLTYDSDTNDTNAHNALFTFEISDAGSNTFVG